MFSEKKVSVTVFVAIAFAGVCVLLYALYLPGVYLLAAGSCILGVAAAVCVNHAEQRGLLRTDAASAKKMPSWNRATSVLTLVVLVVFWHYIDGDFGWGAMRAAEDSGRVLSEGKKFGVWLVNWAYMVALLLAFFLPFSAARGYRLGGDSVVAVRHIVRGVRIFVVLSVACAYLWAAL